jgi:hypothetical protein
MNLFPDISWKTFFIAPLVAAAVAAALWLSVTAAVENFKFARATGQILSVIAAARDMAVPAAANASLATAGLFDRLAHIDSASVRPATENRMASLANPWGGSVTLDMQPALRQLRVQTNLFPAVCRRLVLFYAKDAGPLGLQRVEAHDTGLVEMPSRLLFDAQNTAAMPTQPNPGAIAMGCGRDEQVLLTLTFRLQ